MTLMWLIIWAVSGTPHLHQWNGWAIALLVCVVLDVAEAKS